MDTCIFWAQEAVKTVATTHRSGTPAVAAVAAVREIPSFLPAGGRATNKNHAYRNKNHAAEMNPATVMKAAVGVFAAQNRSGTRKTAVRGTDRIRYRWGTVQRAAGGAEIAGAGAVAGTAGGTTAEPTEIAGAVAAAGTVGVGAEPTEIAAKAGTAGVGAEAAAAETKDFSWEEVRSSGRQPNQLVGFLVSSGRQPNQLVGFPVSHPNKYQVLEGSWADRANWAGSAAVDSWASYRREPAAEDSRVSGDRSSPTTIRGHAPGTTDRGDGSDLYHRMHNRGVHGKSRDRTMVRNHFHWGSSWNKGPFTGTARVSDLCALIHQ